jgi:outer membrane protein
MKFRRIAPALATLAALGSASAADLLTVYRDAQQSDPVYQSARAQYTATLEKLPQARAAYLPLIAGSATLFRNYVDPEIAQSVSYTTHVYAVTLSQPIFRAQNWIAIGQAKQQLLQAEALLVGAQQDLMLRVSQAYFDVLLAQDNVALSETQSVAISEQLAQAKRNFEVGTATITDTHEAQSRFDLSAAQEIAAQNDLENKRSALRLLTGKEYAVLKPLRPDIKLSQPNPNNEQTWVELATTQSYAVQAQQAATAIAALEAKRNSNAHLPTLDFVATYGQTDQTATLTSPIGNTLTQTQVGLQLALPLYAGGGLSSREREAAALSLKARDDLENARRSAALTTRQSYLSVINGIAQVGALEQARVSSQSALDSNKLGYEVGVRINIDVLNAQQQLFSTERDLAVARYNTITSLLKLKAAAGSLVEQDLEEANRALAP